MPELGGGNKGGGLTAFDGAAPADMISAIGFKGMERTGATGACATPSPSSRSDCPEVDVLEFAPLEGGGGNGLGIGDGGAGQRPGRAAARSSSLAVAS